MSQPPTKRLITANLMSARPSKESGWLGREWRAEEDVIRACGRDCGRPDCRRGRGGGPHRATEKTHDPALVQQRWSLWGHRARGRPSPEIIARSDRKALGRIEVRAMGHVHQRCREGKAAVLPARLVPRLLRLGRLHLPVPLDLGREVPRNLL